MPKAHLSPPLRAMALSLGWVCVPVLLREEGGLVLGEEEGGNGGDGVDEGEGALSVVVLLSLRGRPRGLAWVSEAVAAAAAAEGESSLGLLWEPLGRPRGRLLAGGVASGGIACV